MAFSFLRRGSASHDRHMERWGRRDALPATGTVRWCGEQDDGPGNVATVAWTVHDLAPMATAAMRIRHFGNGHTVA